MRQTLPVPTRAKYLDRAKRIVTNDVELWFIFGLLELLDGDRERAAQSWHRSLELSDRYLPNILDLGKPTLGPRVLAEQVLPDRPQLHHQQCARQAPRRRSAR